LVVAAVLVDESSRRLTLEELLALPEPGQRLARLADLGEGPGGEGDRVGKAEDDVPRPEHRDRVLDHGTCLRPVTLEEETRARGCRPRAPRPARRAASGSPS